MCLIDLNCPSEKFYKVNRQSKWDISCVQWNPHASHAHLYCTAVSFQNHSLRLYYLIKECKIVIIFLPISLNICFVCSKELST